MRVHCVKMWEYVNPAIAYMSSAIQTSRSLAGLGKRRASVEVVTGCYVPVALCLLTRGKYYASFRALLEELMAYVHDLRGNPALGAKVSNAEFTRILVFLLNDLFLPPKCTQMTLHLSTRQVPFPIDYIGEPIHNEDCLSMLLDLVDIDILLTLWQLLLMEKNVILMGHLNNVIYASLEGLKMLMFPLKWVLTYIPLLSRNPQQLIAENKKFLAGINTSFLPFSAVAIKSFEGAVYNLDTGELFLNPKSYCTICKQELAELKYRLTALKAVRFRYFERADVGLEIWETQEEEEKWREMVDLPEEERADVQVTDLRDAFLKPLIDNLKHYSSCFTPGLKKNSPNFDVPQFTMKLTRCSVTSCNAVNFWVTLVNTMSFQQLMDEHSNWDESNADVFRALIAVKSKSGCKNVLAYLKEERKEKYVYKIDLKPEISPKELYLQLLDVLNSKSCSQTDDKKFSTYLTTGKEYLQGLVQTLEGHEYFSERSWECLRGAGPEEGGEDFQRLWYGDTGLLRHLSLIFECYSKEDLKGINHNQGLLQRLEAENVSNWQAQVLKAYLEEALGLDPALAIASYQAAYQRNGGWIPFHRFSLLLSSITGPDIQTCFQELEQCEGTLRRIARNVWSQMQESISEDRARSSLEAAPEVTTPTHTPEKTPESPREKVRFGIMRKITRVAAVMGAMRESIGGVEIRTVPLNEKPILKSQTRESYIIVENMLATLKRILLKYKNKVDNEKTNKLFQLLDSDAEFKQLAEAIGELHNIKLQPTGLQHPTQTLSLYLNLHNFVVLYGLLVKKHTSNSAVDWNKFLSSLCVIVGGQRITPLIIQTVLLKAPFNPEAMELAAFYPMDAGEEHPLQRYQLAADFPYVHFGLYVPTQFCTSLRVYSARAVEKQLEEQAKAYCQQVTVDELRRTVSLPAIFYIKDFGSDLETLELVRKVLKGEPKGKSLKRLLKSELREIEKLHTAEDWRFTLKNALYEDSGRHLEH